MVVEGDERRLTISDIHVLDDFESEGELIRYAKKLAQVYRKLYEYSEWSKARQRGTDKCENCGIEFEEDVIKPNVHHEPLTLTEIILKTIDEMLQNDETVNSFTILERVHEKHMNDEVGYKVLCECCHKMIHRKRKKEGKTID